MSSTLFVNESKTIVDYLMRVSKVSIVQERERIVKEWSVVGCVLRFTL